MTDQRIISPLAIASAAVLTGCAFLLMIGAPLRLPLMNLAALLMGLCAVKAAQALQSAGAGSRSADFAFVAASLAIPLTAMFGSQLDGVSRWLVVAGITVQPALVVVPPLVIGLARSPSLARVLAIAVASAGVAMQPDPAAAAMLALGVALALLKMQRSPLAIAVLAVTGTALAAALVRSVTLPPVPFVEGVVPLALDSGPLAIAFAAAGLVLLFLPALRLGAAPREAALAFTGVWLAAIAAALLGPYPTPVIGFSGSAVLGYILSVAMVRLPYPRSAAAGFEPARQAVEKSDHSVRFA